MGKPRQMVVTQGVQRLGIQPLRLQSMFQKAESAYPEQDFLVFDPKGGKVVVSDGDGKRLDELPHTLPEKIWIKTDDYGNRLVVTALLPSEY